MEETSSKEHYDLVDLLEFETLKHLEELAKQKGRQLSRRALKQMSKPYREIIQEIAMFGLDSWPSRSEEDLNAEV